MTRIRRQECRRCGTCCSKGGPALHELDLDLYFEKHLDKSHLFTLRKGELAFDNVRNKVIELPEEIIRIRSEQKHKACIFFDAWQKSCSIYAHRPWECRVLKCWDTDELERDYDQNRLSRLDLIDSSSALGEIITAHENNCSYAQVKELVADIKKQKDQPALDKLGFMLEYDWALREQIGHKAGASQEELNFLLGRALEITLPGFGLEVKIKDDGRGYLFRDKMI